MGAEIFDVAIKIDKKVPILYATKCEFKRNKDTNTTLTFNGDVTTGADNTGATISFEGLKFPKDIDEALKLEEKLESNNIKTIVCAGTSYTRGGQAYKRVITGSRVTITTDDESWSPSDGLTHSFEVSVDKLKKESRKL